MKNCAVLVVTLITPVLMFASPKSVAAGDESQFFLQDHGTVRVLRGLDPGKNFEAATVPEEIDVEPAAAPASEAQAAPPPTRAQEGPKFTREAALERARERGIRVIPAGVRSQRPAASGETRRQAIERARQRGIPVNRAGG